MARKLSITIDDDVFSYLEAKNVKNRSGFINGLIREHQRHALEKELAEQILADLTEAQGEDAIHFERSTILDGLEDWEDDWDDTKAPRNLVG